MLPIEQSHQEAIEHFPAALKNVVLLEPELVLRAGESFLTKVILLFLPENLQLVHLQ